MPFLRFARLQTIFALGGEKVFVNWFDDLVLPVAKGDHGLTGNYYLGLHEFSDMAFAIHFLRRGDFFVDVGANQGSYSLIAAGVAGANVLAVEPVPTTYSLLTECIRINGLADKITPLQVALNSAANAGNDMWFSTDKGTTNSFVDGEYAGAAVKVRVSTLDNECAGLNPVLIKIDVEGFEEDVLSGAPKILSMESLQAVIIEGQTEAVNMVFRQAGFVDREYVPDRRELLPHSKRSSNRIWVRRSKLSEVQERLKTAPQREIYGCRF